MFSRKPKLPRRLGEVAGGLLDGHLEGIGPVVVAGVRELEQLLDEPGMAPREAQASAGDVGLQPLDPGDLVARVGNVAERQDRKAVLAVAGDDLVVEQGLELVGLHAHPHGPPAQVVLGHRLDDVGGLAPADVGVEDVHDPGVGILDDADDGARS